ncbi:hypothetical protein KEM60_03156 [Austwickia sp. TVS 96-490-7B]|uniref:hypothetical protein n=1 Tax=Austwickia sp. TVS 96-490-7B TaxID=2830843 RepID=UPI001C580A11|nr:hypothetical protein [Austwickia sp. TVS 96-490-7B]MBW3086927.1 hypothetical protein [Austwickia sp. TVS 96-490-7B]
MTNIMVDVLVAAVSLVASTQLDDTSHQSWQSMSAAVDAQVSFMLDGFEPDEIDAAGQELGLGRHADRHEVEEAVRLRVQGLMSATLAA